MEHAVRLLSSIVPVLKQRSIKQLMRFPVLFCAFLLTTVVVPIGAETIVQDFTSKKSFDSFWNISTWGSADQQYSASNVKLDTANGWVRLKLSASPAGTKPVCGEITSKRSDFLYGSYRASIRFDSTPGGVVGWFVYKDEPDLHEIDVEYLTQDPKNIHFTLHHKETSVEYHKKRISFDPTAAFHEYRFDWYPEKVIYFIDGVHCDTLTTKVPDAACTIMLNLWSANIEGWGGNAPEKDMYMYIDYVHYFSEYAATSLLTRCNRLKADADFRMASKKLQLYRCNGQVLGELMPKVKGIAPGLFFEDQGTASTKQKIFVMSNGWH